MPTSAAGSKPAAWPLARAHRLRPARGFTLIELMVVLALIGIATALATLALRDSADSALERDAQRLAAVLESARAQARASDTRVVWLSREGGFELQGLPRPAAPQAWLSAQTRALTRGPVLLGPEPLIGPQRIVLVHAAASGGAAYWVSTDGLRPFVAQRATGAGTP